ncbi:hypothetical protein B296_00022370 [Ensete ventricosum]|uniref:Uncharacterized protein n=1 Tax=Ensete ventricosum TaxID=4639 RepID=A0A426ZAC5_ENSVE|nr:hypothetical protein B296_00022370 [Ensete ventricosum]
MLRALAVLEGGERPAQRLTNPGQMEGSLSRPQHGLPDLHQPRRRLWVPPSYAAWYVSGFPTSFPAPAAPKQVALVSKPTWLH